MTYAEQFERIFGEKYVRESYKLQEHSFSKRIMGKAYCSRCGLIALRNPFTQWAIRMGCNSSLHPNYKTELKKATL